MRRVFALDGPPELVPWAEPERLAAQWVHAQRRHVASGSATQPQEEEPCAQHAALTAVLALCEHSAGDFEVTKRRGACRAPAKLASTMVEHPDGIDIANGESGQVTVEHRGANCIAGRFSMKMGEAQVSGRFVAPRCNTVKKLGD